MSNQHTTTRARDSRGEYEALPAYGWRCGTYGVRPELARHASNPEYLAGLRSARACRQSRNIAAGVGIILSLPRLREMRAAIQDAHDDATCADRRLAASYRAAASAAGQISGAGRDIGAVRLAHADAAADGVGEQWAEVRRLSNEYADEVNRLCRLRGLSNYITTGRRTGS